MTVDLKTGLRRNMATIINVFPPYEEIAVAIDNVPLEYNRIYRDLQSA